MNTKILLLSKDNNIFCDFAENILRSYFQKNEIISIRGRAAILDEEISKYRPEYLISFLSPWIVPGPLLASAKIAAINFHPGSPDYPGTGCYNFAIYEKSARYGITCHHMKEVVDSGDIIKVSYFDIAPNESVESLKLKSMNHMLTCFDEIIGIIFRNEILPVSDEKWRRKAFTRKQLDELCEIDLSHMDKDEIELRIRAAYYPGFDTPYALIGGKKFVLRGENDKPLI